MSVSHAYAVSLDHSVSFVEQNVCLNKLKTKLFLLARFFYFSRSKLMIAYTINMAATVTRKKQVENRRRAKKGIKKRDDVCSTDMTW